MQRLGRCRNKDYQLDFKSESLEKNLKRIRWMTGELKDYQLNENITFGNGFGGWEKMRISVKWECCN